MTLAAILAQIALFLWFFGCIRTYRLGKHLLVEGMGVKSAEFVMLCLFAASAALSWLFPAWGCWPLLAVLIFWFTVQFFCHWYYTIFGATPKKLSGYNECFRSTVRLFPASDKRLIPDLYHIALHALILLNIALTILRLARP